MSAEPFQIFVKGLEGKTSTLNDITPNTKILDVKKMLLERFGLEPAHQRLIFGRSPLEDTKTVNDYGIQRGSTLHLVVRLPGGATRTLTKTASPDDDLINDEPDMITKEKDPNVPRTRMPCGHTIAIDSLTAFCRSIIGDGGSQIFCPYVDDTASLYCRVEWQYLDIRRLGALNDDECNYFESKISENYSLHVLGAKECPKCSSFCERRNKKDTSVICLICSRAREFAFCWRCLKQVKKSQSYRCYSAECGENDPRLALLRDAPLKTIVDVANVPSRRACPRCGTIIEHAKDCKHMKCRCKQDFCFVCLGLKHPATGWPCGTFKSTCPVAAVQTVIPSI